MLFSVTAGKEGTAVNDQEDDEWLTAAAVSRQLKPRPAVMTVYRWHYNGVKGIRLPTRRLGARLYFRMADVRKFLDAVARETNSNQASV